MYDVSVVIPAYNAKKTIAKCVESALCQLNVNVEVIVVDDASTDSTRQILNSICDDRLHIFCMDTNGGPSRARNRGFAESSKSWVAVLDADDWFDLDRLSVLIKMAEDAKLDVIADNQKIFSGDNLRPYGLRWDKKHHLAASSAPKPIDLEALLKDVNLGVMQPVIRREFLVQHSITYKTQHWYGEDFRLLYDLLRCGARMGITNNAFYSVSLHPESLTANRVKMFSGMKAILEEIDQDLISTGRKDLSIVIRQAILRTEDTIIYGSVMDPLKRGELHIAMKSLVANPGFGSLFAHRMAKKIIARLTLLNPN